MNYFTVFHLEVEDGSILTYLNEFLKQTTSVVSLGSGWTSISIVASVQILPESKKQNLHKFTC